MENKVINMFPDKNNTQNTENYSIIIKNFIKQFNSDFPEDMDIEDVIGFACNAWNIACISEIMPKNEFDKMISEDAFSEFEKSLTKKMIVWKQQKFASHDKFIEDCTVDEKKDEYVLTIKTQEKEAYIESLMAEEPGFFPEEADFEETYINRYAIVIKPLQPFFDWISAIYPDSPVNEVNEANVYLVDDDIDDVDKWLKKKFDTFFRMELEDWHTNKKEWPQKRNYKMFKEWFRIDFSSMVYDMEKRPVYKEI